MSYSMPLEDLEEDYQVALDVPPNFDEYQKTSRLRRERGRKQKTQKHTSQNGKTSRGKSAHAMYVDDGWYN